jgi:hypothetical protein
MGHDAKFVTVQQAQSGSIEDANATRAISTPKRRVH